MKERPAQLPLRAIFPFLLAVGLLVVGSVLKGPPADPDVLFTHQQILGTFLVFLFFFVCCICWGSWVFIRLKLEELGVWKAVGALVLGPALLSVIAAALGTVGLIGFSWSWLMTLILLAGPVLVLVERARAQTTGVHSGHRLSFSKISPVTASAETRIAWLVASALAIDLVARIANAGLANGTTDPFMYHLFAPRIWSEYGHITFKLGWTDLFVAANWEYLYLWGNSLVGALAGKGLIEGQLFGQWTHLLLGYVGCQAGLWALLDALGMEIVWILLALLATSASAELTPYSWLAQNDFGIFAWTLFSIAILIRPGTKKKRWLATAGVLLGMAISGKCVIVISLIPLLLFVAAREIWTQKLAASWKPWIVTCAGIVAGATPVYLRNFWFTGNPFFPLFSGFFHNAWISESVRASVLHESGHFERNPAQFFARWLPVIHDNPVWFLAPALLVLAFFDKRARTPAGFLITTLISLGLCCAWHFGEFHLHWVGLSLIFLAALGIVAIRLISDLLDSRLGLRFWHPSWIALIALLTILTPHIQNPLKSWEALIDSPSPTFIERNPIVNPGGDAHAWLRMNTAPGDLIVTTGEKEFYFVYYLRIVAIDQQPVLDAATFGMTDPRDVVHALRSFGARWVVDVDHWDQRYYSPRAAMMDYIANAHPETFVYLSSNSEIIDLRKLEDAVAQGCVTDHPANDDFLGP